MSKSPKTPLKSPWGRLVLLPPRPEDDDDAAALRSDPEALRHLLFMPRSMTQDEWRTIREKRDADDTVWNAHVHFVTPPRLLSQTHSSTPLSTSAGQVGIMNINTVNRSGEAGLILSSAYHRTGIATEALYLTLREGFENPDLKLHRVHFVVSVDNVAMRGWLERFGVELESRMREAWSDGEGGWVDTVIYSILEGEWPALKGRLEEKLTARLGPPGV
ncbi:acyl-CoA N-acyltransferase [Ramaria rubella]|nr:acyl-CoA N-acyltransferase [Ramaria rubella]